MDISDWEQIPHVRGKTATQEDVLAGKASFTMDGQRSFAIDIDIPWVVIHQEVESGENKLAVIIQAERIGNLDLAGIRYEDGSFASCIMAELVFLKNPTIELDSLLKK